MLALSPGLGLDALAQALTPAGASDVPVTPDAPTAQQWLRDELAHSEYHQSKSLLDRLLDWLDRTFTTSVHPSLPPAALIVLAVIVVAIILIAALRVAGPVRRTAHTKAPRAVLDDDTRSAAEIRRAAQDAAARGDWAVAVVERFRAIVRSLEERVVLDERPGRTADEAAHDAAPPLPAQARGLADAALLFDEVLYGDRVATQADDQALTALDTAVAAARPVRAAVVPQDAPAEAAR